MKVAQKSGKQFSIPCDTMCVKRLTTLERFARNYVPIPRVIMAIGLWEVLDAKIKSECLLKEQTALSLSIFTPLNTTDNFDTLSKNLQIFDKSITDAMEKYRGY